MFDVLRDGFQCLTIPRSGRYRFEVSGASSLRREPGARIIGEVRLEKGEKITVALGQTGSYDGCGNGGTFVVKENSTSDPQPLFVAAGAGSAWQHYDFSKASLTQTASENYKVGSSGVQKYIDKNQNNTDNENGSINDIYCGGAGFWEGPVTGELREDSVAPKSYKDGLIGGKGMDEHGDLAEGGFGGGGASNYRNGHGYYGAGGGYTGGGTLTCGYILCGYYCDGGGGGSFAVDKAALFDNVHEAYGKCTITYLG